MLVFVRPAGILLGLLIRVITALLASLDHGRDRRSMSQYLLMLSLG